MEPDLAGFTDALRRKRAAFAERADFFAEWEVTFPPGTRLDPETRQPFDPLVTPISSSRVSASAACNVAARSAETAPLEEGQIGRVLKDDIMVIAPSAMAATVASGATEMEVRGQAYEIVGRKLDGILGSDRFLVWGRRKT